MDRGFPSVHPFVCFVYYFMIMAFVMLLFHPVCISLALAGAVVFNFLHDGGRTLAKSWRFYAAMSAAVIIINPIINHRGRTVMFYMFNNPVTMEAFIYGVMLAISLLAILVNFMSLMQVIDYHKFLYLFSSVLPRTAFLIMLTVRFIPLLKVRLGQISIVQKTRGIDMSEGPLGKRARDGMRVLNILVTWSLEEALQTAESMKARGYGLNRRSSYFDYKMGKSDWGLFLLIMLLSAFILAGWYMGFGTLKIYPQLGSLLVKPLQLLFYMAFSLMVLIPVIEEGREILIWRSLK